MTSARRQFNLGIWWLALGYFIFYAPYSAFIKATTTGLWPGVSAGISGFRLLPAVAVSTAVVMAAIVSLRGWWKYAGRRRLFGLSVPCPGRLVVLSGFGTAVIIGTTTLTFTYTGVSIVFALLLMRGGVLAIAPVVDRLFRRRVRWFSWAAFALTVPAILIALADVNNYRLTSVAALTIVAYLSGYVMRLPCVNSMAKSNDAETTYRYFVEEQLAAMFFLVALPAVLALIGQGEQMSELRLGFTDLFAGSRSVPPALIIGALYACLYCFGTLIYLDCRENTFCIPLNRGSSLLAGVFASYVLAIFFGQRPPSPAQLGSAGLIVIALLLLSPLHHFQRYLGKLSTLLNGFNRRLRGVVTGVEEPGAVTPSSVQATPALNVSLAQKRFEELGRADELRRAFLFVCSGNTCRSPMAAAIANAEIAARLQRPFEAFEPVALVALSAGISASVNAPMTNVAQQALRSLGVPVVPHSARNLTVELAHQVEKIFCMTQAHRNAVIDLVPTLAAKTQCLDPDGDIDDPAGEGMSAHLNCAQRIRSLVRLRLDEFGLPSPAQS
jgi:protein-tyrosine-phosphatase